MRADVNEERSQLFQALKELRYQEYIATK